ncbi:MAG: DUF2877 domain-containing protein [Anaerolineae bacterium]|nr:DUF2877 domain-containing protein [Anaerolineae bacterium]
MTVHLIARSLSRSAWERLATRSFDAQVLAVFDHACNLRTSDGRVIALVLPEVGDGPLNIVVDGSPGVFSALEPGMSVWLEQRRLRIGELEIDLERAMVWDPCPDWVRLRASRDTIRDRLSLLQAAAFWCAAEGSFLALVSGQKAGGGAYLAGVKSLDSTSRVVFASAQEAMGLLQAGWKADAFLLQTGAAQLAGLGGGLTPAGDDFLTGAMIWGWLAHPNPGFLGRLLFEAAAPRTTVLSAALLGAAARGECSAAWHALLASLSQGQDAEVDRAVRDVLSHGATSGADALAGFLWAGLCCT